MYYILLIGALLNYIGALKMLREVLGMQESKSDSEEYVQLKYFVVGVATTFGSMYLYLYFNREYIIPLLFFGAALKAWAYISCHYLYKANRIDFERFLEFGVSNGVVALMFISLLLYHA